MCELSEFGNKTADRGLGCALHPRSARSQEGKREDAMGRKVIYRILLLSSSVEENSCCYE